MSKAKIINNQRRYGIWPGNTDGLRENRFLCIEEVADAISWQRRQCARRRGHGPGGDYCKQHAKKHALTTSTQSAGK